MVDGIAIARRADKTLEGSRSSSWVLDSSRGWWEDSHLDCSRGRVEYWLLNNSRNRWSYLLSGSSRIRWVN